MEHWSYVGIKPLTFHGCLLHSRCDVIGQSSDNLPCSFALLKVSTDGNVPTVVGFSRLSKVLQLPKSVLVESGIMSVIVCFVTAEDQIIYIYICRITCKL